MNKSNEYDAFGSYIKDIWIELPGYKFQHSTIKDKEKKTEKQADRWVGRSEIELKLLSYLQSGSDGGSYLITGYRGVGKTSFVNRVVELYTEKAKHDKKKIKTTTISFGQKDIKEIDILRQMIKGIRDNILWEWLSLVKIFHTRVFSIRSLPLWVAVCFVLVTTFGGQVLGSDSLFLWRKMFGGEALGIVSALLLTSVVFAFILLSFFSIMFRGATPTIKLYERLDDLYDRCRSQITKEAGSNGAGERLPFSLSDKLVKQFPLANPKEIENELIEILLKFKKVQNDGLTPGLWRILFISIVIASTCFIVDWSFEYFVNVTVAAVLVAVAITVLVAKIKSKRKFIFIFDEIDKVDASSEHANYHEELDRFEKRPYQSQIYDHRERKRVVINILANLKYLITTAHAKFIFIAGREMFDASLADIADRQSAVSSIFHQVINVDSFLKDSYHNNQTRSSNYIEKAGGLTSLIEEYLEKILLCSPDSPTVSNDNTEDEILNPVPDTFLRKYYDQVIEPARYLEESAKNKVMFSLQCFIVYLTYRSNGSPKKLIRLIEDLIRIGYKDFPGNTTQTNKNIIIYRNFRKSKEEDIYYLRITYLNQYRFGFINYLFRPFLTSNGNFYKSYSDKILVATPYLLDHIIKFHPFAFSLQNLELVPEVLSETRSPELRNFLEELVVMLGQSHLRDTEVGLFDYKFLHKTFHEIGYLNKLFEDESAAFNFTLDETYHVKNHIITKIKEQRSIYKSFIPNDEIPYIKSISFLNELLGDAQFFDQEYDDAMISFSDAVQEMDKKLIKPDDFMSHVENFIIYLRIQLKIGLTYEKMKAHEKAIAVYVEASTITKQYLFSRKRDVYVTSIASRRDLLQIISQLFIAELYTLEKFSAEGVTLEKIWRTEFELLKISTALSSHYGRDRGRETETSNYIIEANFYSHIGTLLYYKNHFETGEFMNHLDAYFSGFNAITDIERHKEDEKKLINNNVLDNLLRISSTSNEFNVRYKNRKNIAVSGSSNILKSKVKGFEEELENRINLLSAGTENFTDVQRAKANVQNSKKIAGMIAAQHRVFDRLIKIENSIKEYELLSDTKQSEQPKHYKLGERRLRYSASTFHYLKTSLITLLNYSEKDHEEADLIDLLKKVEAIVQPIIISHYYDDKAEPNFTARRDKTYLKNLALILNKLADCLYVTLKGGIHITGKNERLQNQLFTEIENQPSHFYWTFNSFSTLMENIRNGSCVKKERNAELFQLVMCMYFWSGQILIRIGKNLSSSFMFRKILMSFQMLTSPETLMVYNEQLEKYFLKKVLQIASWNSVGSDRYQILKYEYHQDSIPPEKKAAKSRHFYLATSGNAEVKEGIILFAEVRLKIIQRVFSFFKEREACCKKQLDPGLIKLIGAEFETALALPNENRIEDLKKLFEILIVRISEHNVTDVFTSLQQVVKPLSSKLNELIIRESGPVVFPLNSDVLIVLCSILPKYYDKEIQAISGLIHPYNSVSTQYIRYQELRLKVKLNAGRFQQCDTEMSSVIQYVHGAGGLFEVYRKTLVNPKVNQDHKEYTPLVLSILGDDLKKIEFLVLLDKCNGLILNSIYSIYEIIKIYHGYGVNYSFNYSSLGDQYRRLGNWLRYYELSIYLNNLIAEKYKDDIEMKMIISKNFSYIDIENVAASLLGVEIIRTMDAPSQFQLALQNYSKARQVHSEGSPYKDSIINMYYLEDDFNDSLYHYGIALERQRINSGKINSFMPDLQYAVDKTSPLYEYKNYVNNDQYPAITPVNPSP